MRIGVGAATLRGAGSAVVGQQVLENLISQQADDEVHAWVPAGWAWDGDLKAVGAVEGRVRLFHVQSGLWAKALTELWHIPAYARRGKLDVLFSMGDTGTPRPGIPHVLLVQQAFLVCRDEELDFPVGQAFKLRLSLMERYFGAGLRGVDRFTVQTEFMKRRLASRWGIDVDLIDVIPSAPAPQMARVECEPDRKPTPYVAYVASAGPHKNHRILPSVAQQLKAGGVEIRFVLTAREDEIAGLVDQIHRLGVDELFEFRGRLSLAATFELLAGATAHVVPSKLESFGLGYLEAMAMGCPVVGSDREFAREVCGEAALYANPDSANEFAEHIATLATSQSRWEECSAAGRVRYAEVAVPWASIAARYRRLLESAAS